MSALSGPALRSRRRRTAAVLALAAVGVLGLSACTAGAQAGSASTASSSSPSPAAAAPAALTLAPAAGARGVSPSAPISVTADAGTVASATLVSSTGKHVTGTMSADRKSWTTTEALGYSKTYTLSATATNADGKAVTKTSVFHTLTPANMTRVYLRTTGGQPLTNGATYGVGIVVVAHFDEPIKDRAAAEKMLTVTTTPHVTGAWYWMDAQNAHWRPAAYYAPGTKVSVRAGIYGKPVGSPKLYGQMDSAASFRIGAKHVSIADDNTHQVKVFFNDKLVRTMPTSMGRGGYVTGTGGKQISLYTPSGTYTVIGHDNPELMDSSSFGLPTDSPLGYKEYIYWATRISTDGIFLHQLNSTVWAQGNTDTSHGCLNLNLSNASWFYKNSQTGDPVQVVHTGGAKLQVWQNGDWTVPWATWVKGGDLG